MKMGKDNTKPRLEKVHGKNIVYIICIEHSRKKKYTLSNSLQQPLELLPSSVWGEQSEKQLSASPLSRKVAWNLGSLSSKSGETAAARQVVMRIHICILPSTQLLLNKH